jgi:Rod binding domain-containing protein
MTSPTAAFGKPENTRRRELEQAAETLVAQTFFGSLLKSARQSPWRSDLWDGGRAGQAYQSMFDQHLAERLTGGPGAGLVRAIVNRIERNFQTSGTEIGNHAGVDRRA